MARKQKNFDSKESTAEESSPLEQCLDEFDRLYPTDDECLRAIEQALAAGMRCKVCHMRNSPPGNGDRSYFCRNCRTENWTTAGSFFDGIKRIRAWFGAIWLIERGYVLSKSHFAKIFSVAYQTAWTILQTLPVVPMRDSNQQSFEISSSIFIELMCRRSRETPARFHPSAEENSYTEDFDSQAGPGWSDGSAHGADPSAHCNARESSNEVVVEDITDAMQKACKDSLPLLPVNSATPEIDTVTESSKQEDFVYSLMPLHETSFAELQGASNLPSGELTSLLTMLEINGRITTVSPWRYRRTEQEPPKPGRALPVQTAIESGIDSDSSHVRGFSLFVKQNYHRISRKYLQIYLASYWFWIDREYWQIGSLFAACLRSRRISKDELMRYVSPRRVKMWLPAQAA